MKKSNAFTLIELLVVITIIGILAAVGLGSFASAQMKSRDGRRKNDLNQIGKALEMYYNDHGQYPDDDGGGGIDVDDGAGVTLIGWGDEFSDSNSTVYMVELPADPGKNQYFYASNGREYRLFALLENEMDRDIPESGGIKQAYSNTDCESGAGTAFCNYGVSSSNANLEI